MGGRLYWFGADSGDDPLPPTPVGYTSGYLTQFFPQFFKKGRKCLTTKKD